MASRFVTLGLAGALALIPAAIAGAAPDYADPNRAAPFRQADIASSCSNGGTMMVTAPLVVSAPVAVPDGCTLEVGLHGSLAIAPGGTLQIRGRIKAAENQRIFVAPVGANAIHGYGTQSVSPRWFGAKGDGNTNDNDAFEQVSKFAATAQSITVSVPRGTYVVGKEDATKPIYDKIAALLTPAQVSALQATMNTLIADGAILSHPGLVAQKDQWQAVDQSLPFLSSLGVYHLYTARPKAPDATTGQVLADFQALLKGKLTPEELAQIASPKRAYAPRDTLAFVKVPDVRIVGERDGSDKPISRLVLQPGLKFGAFDPNTGQPHRGYNQKGAEVATLIPFYIAFSGPMISVTGATTVDISSLELDGNSDKLELGGFYGDTGYQLQNDGIYLQQNLRATVRYVFAHHQGTDGIGVRWSGLSETAPDYPHVLDHVRADHNGRNGITISDANDLVVTNSDVDFTATGRVSSLPRAGIDIESEGVIRNARFDHDNFIGNRGSQISATWNVSYLTFDHVHAKGQQALWMRAPGITFRNSLIEGLVSGLPYGDGQVVNHHAWQGQQVICPSIALVEGQRIVLDTATATREGSDPAKPEVYCPGSMAAGVSLATRITDTQFIADSDLTTGAWNGGMSAGDNVLFANDVFKVIVRNGSSMRLPDLAARSGTIRNSTFEIQKDAMTGPNLIGALGGYTLDRVTFKRLFGPGVTPIDTAYVQCVPNRPNTYVNVTTVHLRWCAPNGPMQMPAHSD